MEHHQKPPTTDDIEAAPSATAEEELRERLRSLHVFDCQLPEFDPDSVPTKPIELVRSWLIGAIDADAREPHAMTLSTVDPDGRPSSRVLILKGLSDERLQFASSRGSRKGRELSATPWAAANFYWPELGRQVRLTGRVVDGGPDDGARDFLARGLESRVESLTGRQSEVLRDCADLDAALDEARARLRRDPVLVPDHWALYQLEPNEIEFWQADRDRRHIRLRYTLDDGHWTRSLLWP